MNTAPEDDRRKAPIETFSSFCAAAGVTAISTAAAMLDDQRRSDIIGTFPLIFENRRLYGDPAGAMSNGAKLAFPPLFGRKSALDEGDGRPPCRLIAGQRHRDRGGP